MNVDSLRIKEKFAAVEKYIDKAKKITGVPIEEFLENEDLELEAERVFEILSQAILDICTHIVSRSKNVSPPASYSACMKALVKIGVISQDDEERYSKLIQMRNFIAHNYLDIDRVNLFNGLSEIGPDFENYRENVFAWIDNQVEEE